MADRFSPDRNVEVAHLPVASPPTNHGHTPAAWTTVVLVLIGSVIASFAVVLGLPWMFWTGLGVVVLGVVVGRIMKMLGLGQPVPKSRDDGRSRRHDDGHDESRARPGDPGSPRSDHHNRPQERS